MSCLLYEKERVDHLLPLGNAWNAAMYAGYCQHESRLVVHVMSQEKVISRELAAFVQANERLCWLVVYILDCDDLEDPPCVCDTLPQNENLV